MTLNGARILVVGGGSGIGFAVARACLAEGAKVVIASTNAEKLASAAERLGGEPPRAEPRLGRLQQCLLAATRCNGHPGLE